MESTINNTFGTLKSAQDNTIVNNIYDYISTVIPSFKGNNKENENALTNRFCILLNSLKPAEFPFFFHHQNIENDIEGTSTDFAAFATYAYAQDSLCDQESPALIKFEAKRLSSSIKKSREKEYVIGGYKNGQCVSNSGGIERFKNGRHGKDVMHAGLIGYIQTDSSGLWLKKINNWVLEQIHKSSDNSLTWNSEDLLVLNNQSDFASYYDSVSSRLTGNPITLKHFWIDISK